MHLRTFTSFLHCGAQNCTQYSRWGRTNTKYSGIITSFDWLVILCLMHLRMQFALLAARAHYWLILSLLLTSTPRSLSAGCFWLSNFSETIWLMLDWSAKNWLFSFAWAWLLTLYVSCSFVRLWIVSPVSWPWMRIVLLLSSWIVLRGYTQPFHQLTWAQADASSV